MFSLTTQNKKMVTKEETNDNLINPNSTRKPTQKWCISPKTFGTNQQHLQGNFLGNENENET